MHLVHDAREKNLLLACRSDAGNLGIHVGFSADQVGGVGNPLAPKMRGVAKLNRIVLDPEINRLGCTSLDDERVVASVAQLRPPRSARVGAGDAVGQRRFGNHVIAAAGRSKGASERSWRKYKFVVW